MLHLALLTQVHTQVIAAAQSAASQEQDRAAQRADKLEAVLESARGAEEDSAEASPPSRLFEELRREQVGEGVWVWVWV